MKNHLTNLHQKIRKLFWKGFIMVLIYFTVTPAGFAVNIRPDESIHLKIKNGNIKEVLKEIESQCNFTFIYNDAYINVNQPISINCSDKPLQELLDEILTVRGIKYTFIDNHIVLTDAFRKQLTVKISGNVRDGETNEALPGVTIVEKGTSNGIITDQDGNFTLNVSETSTLQVSYVGYAPQEIAVAGLSGEISITMKPEVVNLSEIVVIGYGTVRKSDLTGAVSSVSADDIKQNIGSGIDQALQGRTAGVSVTTNSGTPGASPAVRIRGMGTITNSNPFYVVDGMPVSSESVGTLNPGDIESMEVLKDASSAAIYGARAANGVVLITTKKAKTGKSNINFDAYWGVQNVVKKYDIMNAKDWVTIRNAANNPHEDSSIVENTDWQDEIFRSAKISNYQLSFLNGTEKTSYAIVGSYFNQEGIIKGSDFERYTLRVNSTSQIKKWLTIGENIGFSHSVQNLIPEQDEYVSVVAQALTMDPTTPVYTEEGTANASIHNNIGNPVGTIERNHNVLTTNQLLGNAFLELRPFSWLTFKSSIGTEFNLYENEQFFPVYWESTALNSILTTLVNGSYKINNLLFEELLTFKKTFLDKHDVQLLVGYTRQKSTYRLDLRRISSVPDDEDLWFISNGDLLALEFEDVASLLPLLTYPQNFSGVPTDASLISYLGRLIYSFGGKYDLTASIRRDGSSKFGNKNTWGNFPSFAAGWKISEESFFPKNNIINFLKLRVGWGRLGNQEIGDYAAYTNVTYGFNYTLGPFDNQQTYAGGAPRGFANQGIKWETTEMTNIGLDASLIRFRLSVNFDYFIRNTKDMLAQLPVPGVTGIQDPPFVNAGNVSNKGFELNVAYRNRESAFKYGIGFNFGAIRNEVTSLGVGDLPVSSASFRGTSNYISQSAVGQPIASFYGWVTDGYYLNQAEIDTLNARAKRITGDNRAAFDGAVRPGDIKMKDVNGDGLISALDRTYIGNPHPKFTYGVNFDLEYKLFDLSVFGQGVYGNDVFMAMLYYLESGDGYWNTLNTMSDYWQEEGDQTSVPRLGLSNKNMRYSDRYVKSGSYFRIKNVQFGITLPASLTNKIRVEKLRVYINGQNLISFHNYQGFDPEIGIGRNSGTTASQKGLLDIGVDRGMYPLARTVTAGVNLTF